MTLEQIETPIFTLEQFETFINTPENAEKMFEFIAGEIVEVPSNPYVSAISAQIIFLIKLFLHQNKIKGHVTGEAGGYMVAGERYAPDVAYISYEKQPQLAKSGYNPNPPDLAVEVISSDRQDEMDKLVTKVTNYLSVGTVVWVVRPGEKRVSVHLPGEKVRHYRKDAVISGMPVLPELSIKVSDIFAD
ncbi:MAG: Uma2 family endonuclease [Aggregatilineales bacterium]